MGLLGALARSSQADQQWYTNRTSKSLQMFATSQERASETKAKLKALNTYVRNGCIKSCALPTSLGSTPNL